MLLLLLIWALVPECFCVAVPFDEAAGSGPAGDPPAPEEPVAVPPLPGGRVARRERPGKPAPTPESLPWLTVFELQVAARSPRLAPCFEGVPRPGALRWSAVVEASRGTVSDHTLEPVLGSDSLDAAQRACVLEVLSTPAYRLAPLDERSTPPRVSLVIEF